MGAARYSLYVACDRLWMGRLEIGWANSGAAHRGGYQERVIRSVANNTRQDGEDFLQIAAKIPVKTRFEVFPLAQANQALHALKHDAIQGAAILRIDS